MLLHIFIYVWEYSFLVHSSANHKHVSLRKPQPFRDCLNNSPVSTQLQRLLAMPQAVPHQQLRLSRHRPCPRDWQFWIEHVCPFLNVSFSRFVAFHQVHCIICFDQKKKKKSFLRISIDNPLVFLQPWVSIMNFYYEFLYESQILHSILHYLVSLSIMLRS